MAGTRNIDIDLLRAFLAVSEEGGFTAAAERLHRTQSAVSLQIQRLEGLVGRDLLVRSPRHVALTDEGRRLLDDARRLLELHDGMVAALAGPRISGTVRLGAPEDFATAHLPDLLARFTRAFPDVALEVTCDLTLNLQRRFRDGEFDLILVKQEPQKRPRGVRVWREPLVWAAPDRPGVLDQDRLPLVVSPAPCVYRKRGQEALNGAGRTWRIAYTCTSLAGTLAAVRAGLGVTVLPRGLVPAGLRVIDDAATLPDLADTEIALIARRPLAAPAEKLRDHVARSLGEAGPALA